MTLEIFKVNKHFFIPFFFFLKQKTVLHCANSQSLNIKSAKHWLQFNTDFKGNNSLRTIRVVAEAIH